MAGVGERVGVAAYRRIGVGERVGVSAWRRSGVAACLLGAACRVTAPLLADVVRYSRAAFRLGLTTQQSDVPIILMIWARILSQASSSSLNTPCFR